MPIILNHSNIGVQYSTGSNYIIETVKSDLYLRNETVDTIVRDNIQVAPVTPTTYVDSSGNVYAVESYIYSGSANTAGFTRVFTKNTTCDILIVGGGGGGGCGMGGGGGGGQVVHATNVNIPICTYNIIVGSGGAGGVSNNGTNGANSVAFGATANGGGGGGGTGSWGTAAAVGIAGGSGGGGGANSANTLQSGGTVSFGTLGSILASAIRYGNAGGTGKYDSSSGGGGGGGGAGSAGTAGNSISKGNGGNGVVINITGTSYYWAGGGGGAAWATSNGTGGGNGGLGGGGGGAFGAGSDTSGINGLGGINNNIIQPLSTTGAAGANNTGSGGGAGTYNANAGGKGGSGIVIIRYLLGTIPATNYLTNEPVVSPYVIVADGYYPRTPATNSATWTDNGYTVAVKVSDATLYGAIYYICNNKLIDTDEWHSTNVYTINNNTTYSGSTNFKGNAGIAFGIDLGRPIYPKRIRIAPRANHPQYGPQLTSAPGTFKIYASNNPSSWNDNNHIDWILIHSQISPPTFVNLQFTIITLSNIPSISYRYYTMVVMTTASSYGYLTLTEWNIGGDEKIDSILEGGTHKRLSFIYNNDNLVASYKFNGDYLDSSGNGHNLTNVGTVIQSTHIIEGQAVEFDSTDYLEFPATINPYTIWNGKGITFSFWVRFTAHGLWARLIDFQTAANTGNGLFFSVKSAPATGASALYADIGNGTTKFTYSNWSNSIITTLGVWHHFVWSIDVAGKWDIYLNNVRINGTETANIPNISYNLRYINKSAHPDSTWGGQMDDFRIYNRALSVADVAMLYNKTYPAPNLYTLNFPVPTLADINNNSNIILRGAYDIALTTTNAIITPKTGQYIPKPTTFASDLLSIRYNILNPLNDPTGAQWAYSSNNTNMCHIGSVGIGTTNPEYQLDVNGSVNAKSYYLNGRQINEPLSELGLSEGMIAQVRHLTYTQMDVKNNTGWDAINDNLTTGFVIAITPKSNLSKILLNIIVHIGLAASNSLWWGIKLYRKIGAGDWTEVTGPNGTETCSAAATAGTPVWISNTMYAGDLDYQYKVTNVTGTYLDSPNTTSTVYYTAYWNNRIGDNPSASGYLYLNRAESHGDAYRPAPSSSWTASEIWYGPSI